MANRCMLDVNPDGGQKSSKYIVVRDESQITLYASRKLISYDAKDEFISIREHN